MKKVITLALFFVFVVKVDLVFAQSRYEDSLALVELYDSTEGSSWAVNIAWLTNPLDDWYGVTVTGGRVTGLNLNNNSLEGAVPSSIGNLTGLTEMNLSANQLTGSIPSTIGNLNNLTDLILYSNQLTGSIPSTIGDLTNLTDLHLSYNQLTDTIPSEIGNLTNLFHLGLVDNEFTYLPSLLTLDSLFILEIQNNKFTFEDIEPIVGVISTIFSYSPQDSVGELLDTTVDVGSPLTLFVSVGGTYNQYQWKKDEILIPSATDTCYIIDSVTASDTGSYICEITNTVATALTLYSRPKNVSVNPSGIQGTDLPGAYSMSVKVLATNNKLEVSYALPEKASVKFWLYDIRGAKVKEDLEDKPAGFYSKEIDMRGTPKGVYFLKMEANEFVRMNKVLFM